MRVLLEGFRLIHTRDTGGVDSYWRNLLRALLRLAAEEAEDLRLGLLTACLRPSRARPLQVWADAGAELHHWPAPPALLRRLGRRGLRLEWLAGPSWDLVHAVEPVWEFPGRTRLVVTLHDLMYLHNPQYLDPRWAARLLRGTEEMARRAAFWICVSEHTRRDLLEHFPVPPGRTTVVHHGVDEAFRRAGAAREAAAAAVREVLPLGDKPYFLFLGSVEPKKNLPALLQAYARALEKGGLQADLVVAGRAAWGMAAFEEAARAHPALRKRLRFTGFVDPEHLPGLMAGARALVTPSRNEGFGMPVLEAMAAGTPVLAAARGALPEVAGDAGLLFDPDDVEGLAELLRRIDGDPALCETLADRGRRRAAAFSWERCARETRAAWNRALQLP